MHVEGGRVGQQVGPNVNGTYDLGPMQVNTRWVPVLLAPGALRTRQRNGLLRDDGCVNVRVAAWILKQKIDDAGSLYGRDRSLSFRDARSARAMPPRLSV